MRPTEIYESRIEILNQAVSRGSIERSSFQRRVRQSAAIRTCFSDTFAVELLLRGVPIEQVSLLLGHGSVKVTEKHTRLL